MISLIQHVMQRAYDKNVNEYFVSVAVCPCQSVSLNIFVCLCILQNNYIL